MVLSSVDPHLWEKLRPEKIATAILVTPTDTVYGLNTSASNLDGIERIKKLKKREQSQFIYLVRTLEEAHRLAFIDASQEQILKRYWPGAISFVLRRRDRDETIALRMPSSNLLQKLMECVGGPLISTSCNRHGEKPIETMEEARALFHDAVDIYIDGGKIVASPSTLIDLTVIPPKILRQGKVKFSLKSTT